MKIRILFVCLGNICRSPAAEAIFLRLIKNRGLEKLIHVDSAGTGGWHEGNPADKRMRSAAEARGLKINSLARQIRKSDFDKFDLILTMDNNNFKTVKELADKSCSSCCAEIKPILLYSSLSKYKEVPDPYYGGESGFDNVLDILEDACEGIISTIKF
tara:strand:+ start:235 stop:708 length:474 start_codon:yes stop_codon:yes gene_type:complete